MKQNMSNHRRWLHRGAVRRPVRQPSHLQCLSKLDQVSPTECRGWHSAKHGLYIAAGILADNLDGMTRLFLLESRPHSWFQPNTTCPELKQASHGQNKTDIYELSNL